MPYRKKLKEQISLIKINFIAKLFIFFRILLWLITHLLIYISFIKTTNNWFHKKKFIKVHHEFTMSFTDIKIHVKHQKLNFYNKNNIIN